MAHFRMRVEYGKEGKVMIYHVAAPTLIAFAISALSGPLLIPFLRKLKVGQTEREELKSHLKKNGTPTMGGIMILAGILVTSLLFLNEYPKIIPILFLTVGFGAIGFLDDYLKVVLRRSDGLLAGQKMLLQIAVTGVFAFYLLKYTDVSLLMLIPFGKGRFLDFGWDPTYVSRCHWHGKRRKFYRRFGRTGF